MKKVLFLHDTNLSLLRGAELTINQLIALGGKRGFSVEVDLLRDFNAACVNIMSADIVIVNSTSRCRFESELLRFVIDSKIPYVKNEYDYNFCVRRNILCTVDRNVRLCCNTDKFHLFRELFANAALNIFQSPAHFENHKQFYGDAVSKHLLMPPTVDIESLCITEEKDADVIPFFGELNYLKGGEAYLDFASENPDKIFVVYGENKLRKPIPPNVHFNDPVPNAEVMRILGRSKYLFCKPVWPEPSGRLAAEAFLSGCEIISNDRVGTFSFDFYPDDKSRAIREIGETPGKFWNSIEQILDSLPVNKKQSLGNVLIYKSYGGLGDIFFCIPSLYMVAEVSESVSFAVAPRLVSFFTKHLNGLTVVDETKAREDEDGYDLVIELGNYPAFRGYDLPHALKYPTHKRVKQHAIGHYIDAISKFHSGIERKNVRFPYFGRVPNFDNPYYTIHPGAGFLLKIWPTENYARVIQMIREIYPDFRCKVIMGPDDPDPAKFIDGDKSFIEYVTGGMDDVGDAMAGALFHIGNDAGITHVAGAFNVPTVGIYGPTGPGSWGCFSEHNEIIWGKSGNCGLRCNYDVILNCANRVCLSSTSPEKVMGGLFKLLQKAYPEMNSSLVVNPNLRAEMTDIDCMLTIDKNEFVVNFVNEKTRNRVGSLISGDFSVIDDDEMEQFAAFLKSQDIVFSIPTFQRDNV